MSKMTNKASAFVFSSLTVLLTANAFAGNEPGCPNTSSKDGLFAPCFGYLPNGASDPSEASGVHYLSQQDGVKSSPPSVSVLASAGLLPEGTNSPIVGTMGTASLVGGAGQQNPTSYPMTARQFCGTTTPPHGGIEGFSSGGKSWTGWENKNDLSQVRSAGSYTAVYQGWRYSCVYTPQPSTTCTYISGYDENLNPIYSTYTAYGTWNWGNGDNGYWSPPVCDRTDAQKPSLASTFGGLITYTGITVFQTEEQKQKGLYTIVTGEAKKDLTGWNTVWITATEDSLKKGVGITYDGNFTKSGVQLIGDTLYITNNHHYFYGENNVASFNLRTGQTSRTFSDEKLLEETQYAQDVAYQNCSIYSCQNNKVQLSISTYAVQNKIYDNIDTNKVVDFFNSSNPFGLNIDKSVLNQVGYSGVTSTIGIDVTKDLIKYE